MLFARLVHTIATPDGNSRRPRGEKKKEKGERGKGSPEEKKVNNSRLGWNPFSKNQRWVSPLGGFSGVSQGSKEKKKIKGGKGQARGEKGKIFPSATRAGPLNRRGQSP